MADSLKLERGQFVDLTFNKQSLRAMVTLASQNGRSLMFGFDGVLHTATGDAFFGALPVHLDEDGVYRDIVGGEPVQITTPEP